MALVTLIVARHMERNDILPEGSVAEELERRLGRLPPNLRGTQVEEVLRHSISWLRKDGEPTDEIPSFTLH